MNATTKTLTAGQQGVIHMYDTEIAHAKRERDLYEKFGNSREAYYQDQLIAELEAERHGTLVDFLDS